MLLDREGADSEIRERGTEAKKGLRTTEREDIHHSSRDKHLIDSVLLSIQSEVKTRIKLLFSIHV